MLPVLAKSLPDPRDFAFTATVSPKPSVDLRPLANQEGIENQYQIGSCTANAVVSACEILDGKPVNYSRLFNYYTSREIGGNLGEGSTLRNAIHALYKHGLPPEDVWPYDASTVNVKPSQEAYSEAKRTTAIRYELLWEIGVPMMAWDKEEKIKQALSEGLPVVFAAAVSNEWQNMNGVMSAQQYRYNPGAYIGNHAMVFAGYQLAVGFKDGYFITENSWGGGWGEDGYGAFPFTGLNQVYEAWVIREVGLDDLETMLNDMTEEAYQAMVTEAKHDACWATFFKYCERIGATKADGLKFCKMLGFEKLSKLKDFVINK